MPLDISSAEGTDTSFLNHLLEACLAVQVAAWVADHRVDKDLLANSTLETFIDMVQGKLDLGV